MCPACLTTLILAYGGTGSAGCLALLAVKRLTSVRKRSSGKPRQPEKTR